MSEGWTGWNARRSGSGTALATALRMGIGAAVSLVPIGMALARPILPPPPRAVDLAPLTMSGDEPLTSDEQALIDLAASDGDLLLEAVDIGAGDDFIPIHERGVAVVLAHLDERLDTRWPELGDARLAALFCAFAPHTADVAAVADRLFPRLRELELSRTGAEMTAAIWLALWDYCLLRERWVATGRGGLDELDGPAIEQLLDRLELGELGVGLLPPTLLSYQMGYRSDPPTILVRPALADDPSNRDILDSYGGVPFLLHELLHASQHHQGAPSDHVGTEVEAYVFTERVRILRSGTVSEASDHGFSWEHWAAEDLGLEEGAAVERWRVYVALASRIQDLVGASMSETWESASTIARRELHSSRIQPVLRARLRDAFLRAQVVVWLNEALRQYLMDPHDEAASKLTATIAAEAGMLEPVAVTREAALDAWPEEPQSLDDEVWIWTSSLAMQIAFARKLADAEQLDRFLELEIAPVLQGDLSAMFDGFPAFYPER